MCGRGWAWGQFLTARAEGIFGARVIKWPARWRWGIAHLVEVNGADWNVLAPFGGYKQSGNGREFGRHGLEEYLEIKSIQG